MEEEEEEGLQGLESGAERFPPASGATLARALQHERISRAFSRALLLLVGLFWGTCRSWSVGPRCLGHGEKRAVHASVIVCQRDLCRTSVLVRLFSMALLLLVGALLLLVRAL